MFFTLMTNLNELSRPESLLNLSFDYILFSTCFRRKTNRLVDVKYLKLTVVLSVNFHLEVGSTHSITGPEGIIRYTDREAAEAPSFSYCVVTKPN